MTDSMLFDDDAYTEVTPAVKPPDKCKLCGKSLLHDEQAVRDICGGCLYHG